MSFVVTGAKLLVIHSTMRWPVRLAGDSQLAFQSQTAGPDLENAKRGVPEQAGVQALRKPLAWFKGNAPAGGRSPSDTAEC